MPLLGRNQLAPSSPEQLLSKPPFLHNAEGWFAKTLKEGAGCRVSRSGPIVVGAPAHRLQAPKAVKHSFGTEAASSELGQNT